MSDHITKNKLPCRQWLPRAHHFSHTQWEDKKDNERRCNECILHSVDEKECSKCGRSFPRTGYSSDSMWRQKLNRRKCRECEAEAPKKAARGHWQCKAHDCDRTLPKEQFSEWRNRRENKDKADATLRCNVCYLKEREEEEQQKENAAMVIRHKYK